MNETFFIADTHFGHNNIITFDELKPYRAFDSIFEHDEYLIKQWNSVVSPKDRVFHLGDFCFGKKNLEIAGRLNGRKILVMGNHDHYSTADYLKYFDKCLGASQFQSMILTHIPVHPEQMVERFTYNIHGHLHSKPLSHFRYQCVSVEQINMTPISYEQILERIEQYEQRHS